MIRGLKNVILVVIILVLSPLIILLVIVLVVTEWFASIKRKKVRRAWLQQNDYSYFIIYSIGKRKKRLFEEYVIPQLNPGVQIATFDGKRFDGFINTEMARLLPIYEHKGFPIIGKIENGEVTYKSMKSVYLLWVIQNYNIERFINEVLDGLDEL